MESPVLALALASCLGVWASPLSGATSPPTLVCPQKFRFRLHRHSEACQGQAAHCGPYLL